MYYISCSIFDCLIFIGLEEINEFIDDIKLEPSLYVPFSVSPSSFNDSESIGSDWQLETPECMMQSLDPKVYFFIFLYLVT